MNDYLKNLEKIEFVITYACTGRCRHCSEGEHKSCGEHISPDIAADSVRKICSAYNIKTVMTFGGEPLLYPDAVYAIQNAAQELSIPKRQVITNGYFSNDISIIEKTANNLAKCGVNDLLLSVDAFHQETIPLEIVKTFATEVKKANIPIHLQPAWLVSKEHENPYNLKTKSILREFYELGIEENDGNIIFPEGNALKYLGEYFTEKQFENPYIENPNNVKCVSFEPNGTVLNDNVYKTDIMDILKNYKPL